MASTLVTLPEQLPLLGLNRKVILPGGVARINLGDSKGCALAELEYWNTERRGLVGLAPIVKGEAGFNTVGTAARVLKVARVRRGGRLTYTLLVEAVCRFEITAVTQEDPYFVASVTQLDRHEGKDDTPNPTTEKEAVSLVATFKEESSTLIALLQSRVPAIEKLQGLIDRTPPHLLCDLLVMAIDATFEERLAILNTLDLVQRFERGLQLLQRQLLVLKTASQVGESLASRAELEPKRDRRGRMMVPSRDRSRSGDGEARQRGRGDEVEAPQETVMERMSRLIAEANMPPGALKAATEALQKVKDMEQSQQMGPEHQKTVAWLEWMVELPWSKSTAQEEGLDLGVARQRLDDDHYGLEKIKRRIVEYAAVRWLNPGAKGSILCLVGPPGVGKTSLGKSIAHTLGRAFHRVSLGGIRDEADVRGFNRTYVGSQPGRIIQAMRQAKSNDPVLLLDEIDKISMNSSNGNPSAALLEVLDPSQNTTFVDHYIGTPFDLSKIVFIATANSTDTIPGPLLDRMEVIRIPGYTLDEKVNIAAKYIVPRQLKEHGIFTEELDIPTRTLVAIGEKYTREAGVRNLERNVAAVCRSVAVRMVELGVGLKLAAGRAESEGGAAAITDGTGDGAGKAAKVEAEIEAANAKAVSEAAPIQTARVDRIVIEAEALLDILGPPVFSEDENPTRRITSPGIAMGLAASELGGSVLFVEASKMPGSGHLKLTGSLGDVIQESSHLAMAWLRSHAAAAGLPAASNVMDNIDVHVHFPEGAVGKDGPSAGVALVTVLTSLLSDRLVRNDTAMTGEITLSGAVLPVGGVQQKVLAAHRLGVHRIVLPRMNWERDLMELSDAVRESMTFIPVDTVTQVLENTLVGGLAAAGARAAAHYHAPSKL